MTSASSTLPSLPLTVEILREFAIRTDRGLWELSHQEGDYFYFSRSGSRTIWAFSEPQLLQIMQHAVSRTMFGGEFANARPDWYKRDKRVREASIAALRTELQDENHQHAACIPQLMELFRQHADEKLREYWHDDAKLRQQTISMLANWISPAVSTEWLLSNGPLNNMCGTWRKAFGALVGVKVTKSATNKALITAFEPARLPYIQLVPQPVASIATIDWSKREVVGYGGYAVVYRVAPGIVCKVGQITPDEAERQRFFARCNKAVPVMDYRETIEVPAEVRREVCPFHGVAELAAAEIDCRCAVAPEALLMPQASREGVEDDPAAGPFQNAILADSLRYFDVAWDDRWSNVAYYAGHLVALDFGEANI